MKVRIDVINQGTKEVLLQGISPTSAKEYITQKGGKVTMVQEWENVPYKHVPGVGMLAANLRRLWVQFPSSGVR